MKIFIGADHGGEKLGHQIEQKLQELGYDAEYTKLENNPSDDYPDFAFDVCQNVLKNKESIGILLCKTATGMSIAANKIKGIYCAKVADDKESYLAKNHNNANVLAFEGNKTLEEAIKIIESFLKAPAPNEERHLRRIAKIIEMEKSA